METTQSIVYASQVIDEAGNLTLGTLPLDLGVSQLANAGKDTIILANGQLITLTGDDNDFRLLVADRNIRLRQTLFHLYLGGLNLERMRDYFIKAYGSPKEFWQKMFDLTGYSRSKLEAEIKISQGFTLADIQSLAEVGTTQAIAIRLLKAAPSVKSEAVEEARQGKSITKALVDELTGEEDDENEDAVGNNDNKLASSGSSSGSRSVAVEDADKVIDVEGSFTDYKDLVQDAKDYSPSSKSADERLQNLVASIYKIRAKHEITTIRGESLRTGTAIILAEFYGITLPKEEEQTNEPNWVKEARNKLPKTIGRRFAPLYLMAFVEGHLAFINGETDAPAVYEDLYPKTLKKKESVEAMYDVWAVGYGLAKASKQS